MSFPVGRLTDGDERLRRDFVEFSRLWLAVRDDWLDERCARFESDYLSTLGPSLNRFTASLHEFCDTLRKADHALKEDRGGAEGLD